MVNGPYLSPTIGVRMEIPVSIVLEKATSIWEDHSSVFIEEVSS